jgi:hypothetical protein
LRYAEVLLELQEATSAYKKSPRTELSHKLWRSMEEAGREALKLGVEPGPQFVLLKRMATYQSCAAEGDMDMAFKELEYDSLHELHLRIDAPSADQSTEAFITKACHWAVFPYF